MARVPRCLPASSISHAGVRAEDSLTNVPVDLRMCAVTWQYEAHLFFSSWLWFSCVLLTAVRVCCSGLTPHPVPWGPVVQSWDLRLWRWCDLGLDT